MQLSAHKVAKNAYSDESEAVGWTYLRGFLFWTSSCFTLTYHQPSKPITHHNTAATNSLGKKSVNLVLRSPHSNLFLPRIYTQFYTKFNSAVPADDPLVISTIIWISILISHIKLIRRSGRGSARVWGKKSSFCCPINRTMICIEFYINKTSHLSHVIMFQFFKSSCQQQTALCMAVVGSPLLLSNNISSIIIYSSNQIMPVVYI